MMAMLYFLHSQKDHILLGKMWYGVFCFFTRSKNKVKIFFWKMYAKIYFCTKDILALPSFFTVLCKKTFLHCLCFLLCKKNSSTKSIFAQKTKTQLYATRSNKSVQILDIKIKIKLFSF